MDFEFEVEQQKTALDTFGCLDIDASTPAELEVLLAKLCHECNTINMDLVKAKDTTRLLEMNKGRRYGQIMLSTPGSSISERERKADVSEEWHAYLQTCHEARCHLEALSAQADAYYRAWETVRSLLSSKSRERRMC